MADRFDDDDSDEEGYFAEVDEGENTGKSPKFIRIPQLELSPTDLDAMKVDDLFATYIELRNQLTTDRQGWKAREAKSKAQMATIAAILLTRSQNMGVTSLAANTGTGYQQRKERIKVAPDGWEALTEWILQTKNFQVVQRRVSPDAVKEVREETGAVPPGVEVTEELTFVVRSPTVRKGR